MTKVNRIVLLATLLLMIFSLSVLVFGQPATLKNRLDKPTIYLSFERFGGYKSPCGEPESDGIWLRLNNDSPWSIFVEGYPVADSSIIPFTVNPNDRVQARGVKNGAEMKLRYDFENIPMYETKRENGNIILRAPVDTPLPNQSKYCSQKWMGGEVGRSNGFWIRAGNSILFSIPKDFLTEKMKVNIQYGYEWESTDGYIRDHEPHHLIYFYGVDVPAMDIRR